MGRLWKADLETGNAALDGDHRDLFALLEALEAASAVGDGAQARGLLGEFLCECGAHFAREEALMAEIGYAEVRAHRDAHALYLDDLRRFLKSGLRPESPGFRLYVSSRMAGWFLQHIKSHDTPLAAAARDAAAASPGARPVTPPSP